MWSKFVAIAITKFESHATIGYIPKRLWLLLAPFVRLDLGYAMLAIALRSSRTNFANKALANFLLCLHASPPLRFEACNLTAGHELLLAASS
jgi:hypothetical protein